MDGAHLVVDPDQAVADVLEIARAHGHADVSSSQAAGSLRGELQVVYESLDGGATTDEIVDATGLDSRRVASALTELELDGLVRRERGRWRSIERDVRV